MLSEVHAQRTYTWPSRAGNLSRQKRLSEGKWKDLQIRLFPFAESMNRTTHPPKQIPPFLPTPARWIRHHRRRRITISPIDPINPHDHRTHSISSVIPYFATSEFHKH